MSITQYIGRVVDINIQRADTWDIADDDSGNIITGIAKLAQQFAVELMSLPSEWHDGGSTFLADFFASRWLTANDVTRSFVSAIRDVERNLEDTYTDATPADERFGSAELLAVTFTDDAVMLTIELASQEDGAVLIYPLPVRVS